MLLPAPTATLANARDLGGLPVPPDRVTRAGVLYRSDAPLSGDASPAGLLMWPPATVIDLRAVEEGPPVHPLEAWGARIHRVPLLDLHQVDRPDQPKTLTEIYQEMLADAATRLAAVVETAAQGSRPVLVHCAAGKDRTGVAIAVLLLAAGVEPAAVVADYVRTDANMPGVRARLASQARGTGGTYVGADAPSHLMAASPTAISVVVHTLLGKHGGVKGWLLRHGVAAASLRAWSDRLVHRRIVGS
jgi:protein-tyrosine phosphatase